MRRRGPPPTSLAPLFHSARARSETAALAAFCRIYGTLPSGSPARRPREEVLTLEFGERLCQTYDTFRASFPKSKIAFESFVNFVLKFPGNEVIRLGRCPVCGATILIDRLAPGRLSCEHCWMVSD